MKKNNKKGFTLVELVIVVAVMAILVAVAIPTIGSIRSSAEASVNNSNAQTIESIVKLAEAEQGKTELQLPAVKKAIVDAKLGIDVDDDAKVFYYDSDAGKCSYADSEATEPAKGYVITFQTEADSAGKTEAEKNVKVEAADGK